MENFDVLVVAGIVAVALMLITLIAVKIFKIR